MAVSVRRWLMGQMLLWVIVFIVGNVARGEESQLAADREALSPLQPYVGQWRGVGLPRQGSNQGAWTEQSEWSWRFDEGRAELVASIQRGKFFERLVVRPAEKTGEVELLASGPANGERTPLRFRGAIEDGFLQVERPGEDVEFPARITARLVAGGDRMTVLYEKRLSESTFARLAEVGATRRGSMFAKTVASGPECVVTGGLGTIAVEYDGKTYYVCCGGCRDLFDEDPAGVLADYRERKAAERAAKPQ